MPDRPPLAQLVRRLNLTPLGKKDPDVWKLSKKETLPVDSNRYGLAVAEDRLKL